MVDDDERRLIASNMTTGHLLQRAAGGARNGYYKRKISGNVPSRLTISRPDYRGFFNYAMKAFGA